MNIQQFVNLHRNCGYKINEVCGYYFYCRRIKGDLFPLNSSFPPNYQISVNKKLVNALKWKFLVSPVLINARKKDLYEFILTTDNYQLDRFDRKVRNRIKKSIQTCVLKRPSLENLLTDGLIINRQTCERQSREDKLLTDKKLWEKYITSIYKNPEFIILGAFFEDKLTGYLIIYELEGKFNMLQALIDRSNSSATNPMSGLIYTAVNNLIEKYGKITISYGMHIYQTPSPLVKFKQKMLFNIVPLSRGYIINPVLLALIKFLVFVTIKIFNKKHIKYRWLRHIIWLYQGHRRLLTELSRNQIPALQNDRFQIPHSSYGFHSKLNQVTLRKIS